jgi:hypothetical protein
MKGGEVTEPLRNGWEMSQTIAGIRASKLAARLNIA